MSSRISSKRIDGRTRDGHDKRSWIAEGDRLLRSSGILRDSRRRRRAAQRSGSTSGIENILKMEAAVHGSILLLAYATELFLKAGLTRLYVGCTQELFRRDIKRYGHNLKKLATEVEYPCSDEAKRHLKELRNTILADGRYPFLSETENEQIKRNNARACKFWSDEHYRELIDLCKSIREHVSLLDQDSSNPSSLLSFCIDDDGYVAFRCGGGLSPRLFVKYSSQQKTDKRNNKRALSRLLRANLSNPLLEHHWGAAKYRCVKH